MLRCAPLLRFALALVALALVLREPALGQPRLPAGFPSLAPGHVHVVGDGPVEPRFGTAEATYYRQAYTEFVTWGGASTYDDCILFCGNFGRYSSTSPLVGPQPHLPGGARLTYLELDYCDTSPTGHVTLDLMECSYTGANCTSIATIQSTDPGTPGCTLLSADLTPLNYTVDNYTRQLFPMVGAGDITTLLNGIIFGYKLQVSPAPVTATFPDVPVGHQFFRYVEALVDAGITAGCGGGLYCPNSPLTRGQMAAFLSIALGLHYSQ